MTNHTSNWISVVASYLICDICTSCTMFRRKKSYDKKLLEHKLYLARESPEPIFDIASCDLTEVPSGIYSLCNVFLKESLVLCHNQLHSLSGGGDLKDLRNLRVLNLAHNEFEHLPADIALLINIEELYIENNKLKTLPNSLCNLVNLKILTVNNNKLKCLPEDIGQLNYLQMLNLEGNPAVTVLPKSFHKLGQLNNLYLEDDNFSYPPKEVVKNGVEAILKFICADIGVEYVAFNDVGDRGIKNTETEIAHKPDKLQEKISELEKQKMKKAQEFLEMERNNEYMKQQEIEMANAHKAKREQLLQKISRRQSKLDLELGKFHQARESERFRLIEQLQEAENNADLAINNLLTLSKEPVSQLLEKEEEEKQKLLAAVDKCNRDFHKSKVLTAMRDILKQETELFNKYSKDKSDTSRSILEQELESDTKLSEILQIQDEQKSNFIQKIMEDSDLQRAAVGTLLERGDGRSWGLLQQVRLVESQLAALTNIELDRKKLKMDEHINDLAEKRLNLSMLLMDLLDQQQERRAQLISTIQILEDCNSRNIEDFWLRQYQRLLEKLPEGLSQSQKNLDPKLAEVLLANGVLHCLPFFAKITQSQSNPKDITELDLIEAGITSTSDRQKILNSLHAYAKEHYIIAYDNTPSAPMLESEASAPSAPPLSENIKAINTIDCVVCLDIECQVIFVPCGHFCCCSNCSVSITQCPLCRTIIQKKITMEM